MAVARKTLIEHLLDKQLITPAQAEEARAAGPDPRKFLIDKGYAVEVDVYEAWAKQEGVPFVDLNKHKPEPSAINVVPVHVVKKHNAMPVRKDGNRLFVAMINPKDIVAIDELRMQSRLMVQPMASAPSDIMAAIKGNYADVVAPASNPNTMTPAADTGGGMRAALQAMQELGPATGTDADDEDGGSMAEQAPVIRMVNAVMVQAIDSGASDIHIEPGRRNVRVRFRVDGVLREVMAVPKHIQPPMIARCKIMADMNIAERRVPQDGRIGLRHNNKDYDMRVSCLPSQFGEKIVMRILDKATTQIGLGRLGFRASLQQDIEVITDQPNGMFIVTGPTGSGKTTTLYSILNRLNTIETNILTAEDPVEYELAGVTQVGMNPKAGLTFASALRSFLRQDPDIIMVGEMRDLETASIGIESALTGHLVLSTLHTNDAASATLRLADMGVERFLISATLVGILAQRLARTNCKNCREPYTVKAHTLRSFGLFAKDNAEILADYGIDQDNPEADVTIYRGRGCEACGDTGFKGRTGVHELLKMTDEIRDLVVRTAPLTDIYGAARRGGLREMREDGLFKILNGDTTPKELA
ncbi:MAG: ATPase, T2SS/T4P/T4SS family, partial [Armatimonas sp.]